MSNLVAETIQKVFAAIGVCNMCIAGFSNLFRNQNFDFEPRCKDFSRSNNMLWILFNGILELFKTLKDAIASLHNRTLNQKMILKI